MNTRYLYNEVRFSKQLYHMLFVFVLLLKPIARKT